MSKNTIILIIIGVVAINVLAVVAFVKSNRIKDTENDGSAVVSVIEDEETESGESVSSTRSYTSEEKEDILSNWTKAKSGIEIEIGVGGTSSGGTSSKETATSEPKTSSGETSTKDSGSSSKPSSSTPSSSSSSGGKTSSGSTSSKTHSITSFDESGWSSWV